ncbi:hypothetical protein F5B17DRAFT_368073 [Nemania serpens]|nr:hypothetical protein F5B17DRAFT_368073 [Nemania serpens]
MGLLSFLSKKSHLDLTEHGSLKTSAYNATVASSPPIRGAYPVRGNGSKILEKFQESHPNLVTTSHYNTPAPSPLVPRRVSNGLHGSGEERPRTAPSKRPSTAVGSSIPQSQSTPGLPPPPKKKYGPYRLPSKVVTDVQTSPITAKPAPSPVLVSLYSGSVYSGESGKSKGYVDLLDAQSMIKPSDFYGRIQATGAKNYGEDVADRNMKDKSTRHDKSIAREQLSAFANAKWTAYTTQHVDDDSADELPRRPRTRHSVSSNLQYNRMSPDPFPKRTSSRLPPYGTDEVPKPASRAASIRSEKTARRKSMPSLASEARRSLSTVKKGRGEDPDIFPDSLRDRALAATAHKRENTRPNISSKRQSLVSSHVEQSLDPKSKDFDNPLQTRQRSADQPRRKTISHHSAWVGSRALVKRQSLMALRSKSRGELYEDTYHDKGSLRNAQFPRDQNSARRQLGSTTDLQDSLSDSPAQRHDNISQIIASLSKCTSNEDKFSQSNHTREQSPISPSNASIKAYRMETPVPERASSLSHWSSTSETAMSTLSSNPFRPQSGHTTNTSVDFSPNSLLACQSIPPIPDLPFLKPPPFIAQDTSVVTSPTSPTSRPSTRNHQWSDFYLEDYASPTDSSTSSRGSYEEDLLFSETGYGISGHQISGLPGLFDAAVPTSSTSTSTSRTLENEVHNNMPELLSHIPIYPQTDSNHSSFDNPEQMESSDDDELNFDIPMSRTSSGLRAILARHRFSTRRQPVSEEDEDDPDLEN